MRRLTVILTAALVAAAASAQLQWEETAWDFGIIKEVDGKVAHRFAYRNVGADTVVVKRTSSSCGCTTARLADTVILPGDSGSLLVEFNPSYRPGPFKKHVAVHTDKGTTQLQIAGKVRPEGETVGRIFPEKAGDLRLTSRTTYFAEYYEGSELLSHFDGILFSGPIRLAKPSPEIYSHFLRKFDLKAEECFFIDDLEPNINAAKEAGMGGLVFTGDINEVKKAIGF